MYSDGWAEEISGETVRFVLHYVIQALFDPQTAHDFNTQFLMVAVKNVSEFMGECKAFTISRSSLRIIDD